MLCVLVKTRTQPGQRDAVRRLWATHLQPRIVAQGTHAAYAWVDDQQDPDAFVLFEIYRDPAQLQANARAEWFAAYLAQAGPLLAGEPEVTVGVPTYALGMPEVEVG